MPVLRQEFVELAGLLGRQPFQHVLQVGVGLVAVQLGALCRPPNYAERFCRQSAIRALLRRVKRAWP